MAEPRNAHTLPHFQSLHASPDCINPSDDFMTGNYRNNWVWQFAINDVKVRAADSASGHLHPNLAWARLVIGQFCPFKSSSNFL
jgi:hypothetical protein